MKIAQTATIYIGKQPKYKPSESEVESVVMLQAQFFPNRICCLIVFCMYLISSAFRISVGRCASNGLWWRRAEGKQRASSRLSHAAFEGFVLDFMAPNANLWYFIPGRKCTQTLLFKMMSI